MARPSEYDYLKEHIGISVIYALYTEEQGIRYIGHSKNVFERFKNHLSNHESESNTAKFNWINKYKDSIKIELLSINPECWETEEKLYIAKHNNLLNICLGGKNNRIQKPFELLTDREHLQQANKSLKELNKYYKSRDKVKRFKLFTEQEINNICNGVF